MTGALKAPATNRSLEGKQVSDSVGVYGGSSNVHPLIEDVGNGEVDDPRRSCRGIGEAPGKKSADS